MPPAHLYVHVPFCARRCVYCDFSIAVRRSVPVEEYARGIRRELQLRYPPTDEWAAETIYLGGGTPSRLGPAGVALLMTTLRERVSFEPGAEVTIECNPDDVDDAAVESWLRSGINRVSLGVQSFDDGVLRWMHRSHDAVAATRAAATFARHGITNWSLDLIFALPPELSRDWTCDLARALELSPGHLSLYGLTVEPGTALGKWTARGGAIEAPEDRYADEFLAAHDALTAAGYRHYEVSNFAGAGGISRHNSCYWRGVPYAGLGPAAHEYDGRCRRWNERAYAAWLAALDRGESGVAGEECLTPANRIAESVYLGLRTDGGLELMPTEFSLVEPWQRAGWAEVDHGRVRLTAEGWLRLDALGSALTASRSR